MASLVEGVVPVLHAGLPAEEMGETMTESDTGSVDVTTVVIVALLVVLILAVLGRI